KDEEIEQTISQLLLMRSQYKKKDAADAGETEPKTPADLTDDFVKTLGGFENVADFRNKIKENIKLEKEMDAKRKNRELVAEKLVAGSKCELPAMIVESEAHA